MPRGYYAVTIQSIWADSEPSPELAHFDGNARWTRCITGDYIDPEKIVDYRGPLDVLASPMVKE